METVAGGDQSGGSTIHYSGAFTFRTDLALIPSIGGLTWRFGVNYLRNPTSTSSSSSASCSPAAPASQAGLLGPYFSFPQDISFSSNALSTGEFTTEGYQPQGAPYLGGTISRSGVVTTASEFVLTSSAGAVTRFYNDGVHPTGRIKSITDRYGNTQSYAWSFLSGVGVLNTVTDGYGRQIQYTYSTVAGGIRLTQITDFIGRQINFQYDGYGRLEVVVAPSVNVGASNPTGGGTNTFPNGFAYVFRYDACGRITLVFYPKEVNATPGAFNSTRHVNASLFDAPSMVASARIKVQYDSFDRVVVEEVGNAATNVGGKYTFAYTTYATPQPNTFDASDPITRFTSITDRNGNPSNSYFNARGMTVFRQVFQKPVPKCSLEAGEYDTYTSFNAQNQPLLVQLPEGNVRQNVYFDGVVSGISGIYTPMRGLLKSVTAFPDAARGGSGPSGGVQTQLQTRYFYEPLYNQVAAVVDPRGNPINPGGAMFPPQNGFGASAARYETLSYFDYQEDSLASVQADLGLQSLLNLTSSQIGSLVSYVSTQMVSAALPGFATSLGDINGDGVTTSHLGSLIYIKHPSVTSVGSGVVGDQTRAEVMTVNLRGQVATHTDPAGNSTVTVRFPFNQPDGVHATSGQTVTSQYGWVKETHVDVNPNPGGGSNAVMSLVGTSAGGDLSSFSAMIAPPPDQPSGNGLNLTTKIVSYDQLGNALSVTNPRGFTTATARNELGEPYQVTSPAPYSYIHETLYDANRNVTDELTQDQIVTLDANGHFTPTTGATPDVANVPSQVGSGGLVPQKFWNHHAYDLLDNRTLTQADATGSTPNPLNLSFTYDANQNPTLTTKPEGNIVEYDYDERNLKIAQRIGRGGAEPGSVTVWTHDRNGSVVNEIAPVQRGTNAQALAAAIGNAFGSVTTTYQGDYASQITYDGFDRAISAEDAVGGVTQTAYDPVSNAVQATHSGTVGGPSPSDRTGSANVTLSSAETRFDEGSRLYESQQDVFLPPTLTSGRTITHVGGGLAINSVPNTHTGAMVLVPYAAATPTYTLTRNIYDPAGRKYKVLQDNTGTHQIQYDGAHRTTSQVDPMFNGVTYDYDNNGNVIHTKRFELSTATLTIETFEDWMWHDVLDRTIVTAHQGPDAAVINPSATPVSSLYGTSALVNMVGFDSRNNSTITIDPKQNTSRATFDGASRLLTSSTDLRVNGDGTQAITASITTTRTLDGNGRLSKIQDANGNITQYAYDTLDRQTTMTFPDSKTRLTQYNEASNVTVYTDELGTTFTTWDGGAIKGLDALGRVTLTQIGGTLPPGGGTTKQTFQYDGLSRQTEAVDQTSSGTVTVDQYFDSSGRVVEEKQTNTATLYVTHTEYTSYPCTETTYPNNRKVDSFHDLLYRRNVVSDAGGVAIVDWNFFGPGRVADWFLGNGVFGSRMNNTSTNSAVQLNYPNPAWGDPCSDRLGYDGSGRAITKRYFYPCSSSSSSGSRSSSSLSSLSSRSSSSLSSSSSVSSVSSLSSLSMISGSPTSSLASTTSSGGGSVGPRSILYLLCGTSSSATSSGSGGGRGSASGYPSGSSGAPASSGGPCSCTSPAVFCDLLVGFTSKYDPSSNKLFERHLHAECRSFLYPATRYDSANRTLTFQRGILNTTGTAITTNLALPATDFYRNYNLDLTGNWVSQGGTPAVTFTHDCTVHGSQDRTTNNLNQVATENGSPLSYDAKGNLLGDGTLILTYDAFNRLITASGSGPDGNPLLAYYSYDAHNRRVLKNVFTGVNPGTTTFLLDGQQVLEERDGAGAAVLRQYVWGQYVDELIQQREFQYAPAGQGSADWYLLSDLLYRASALTDNHICKLDPDGGGPGNPFWPNYVEVYDMDIYGRTKVFQDPGKDKHWFTDDDVVSLTPYCHYLYTGREYDAETGLYFYRARYYYPGLGRFVSRDPIGYRGGPNLYAYGRNNPSTALDAAGTDVNADWTQNLSPDAVAGIHAALTDNNTPNQITHDEVQAIPLTNKDAILILQHIGDWTKVATAGIVRSEEPEYFYDKYIETHPVIIRRDYYQLRAEQQNAQWARNALMVNTSKMLYLYSRLAVPTADLISAAVMAPTAIPATSTATRLVTRSAVVEESLSDARFAALDEFRLAEHAAVKAECRVLADSINAMKPFKGQPYRVAGEFNEVTGEHFFGYSGRLGRLELSETHPILQLRAAELQARFGVSSLERFSIQNCAEFKVLDTALKSGASEEHLFIQVRNIADFSLVPRCSNCQITVSGAQVFEKSLWDLRLH